MANRYLVSGGTGNWNSSTNWSETDGGASGASFPVSGDAVFLTATSATGITVNVASACSSFNCTGYTNTLTMTSTLTLSSTSVTLSAEMTIVGSGGLITSGSGTFTSNTKTWPNALTCSGTLTITLADNARIGGRFTAASGGNCTINGTGGATLTLDGGLTQAGISAEINGNARIIFNGGSIIITSSGAIANNITFNSGTVTITSTNPFRFSGNSLIYVAGTVVTTNTTLVCNTTATLDCAGITWNNVQLVGVVTYTLIGKLVVGGLLTIGSGSQAITINGIIEVSGGVTTSTTGTISGTGLLKLLAGQTITRSQTGVFSKSIEINAPGSTITFSGNCSFTLGLINIIDVANIITGAGTWKPFWSSERGGTFYNIIGGT